MNTLVAEPIDNITDKDQSVFKKNSKAGKKYVRVSEVLLREIKRRGIKRVFGVPGRENASILFNEVEGLEYITTRVEFTAGIMADFTSRHLSSSRWSKNDMRFSSSIASTKITIRAQ